MTDQPEPAPHVMEHVLDAEGHFHVEDAPIDLSHYLVEDWVSLAFFWLLGLCVFYQFFTRYVLNDSAASDRGDRSLPADLHRVRRDRRGGPAHASHPRRLRLPAGAEAGRARDVHDHRRRYGLCSSPSPSRCTIQMMTRMASLKMTIIDLPMNIVYGICAIGFAAATFARSRSRSRTGARVLAARASRARDRGGGRVSAAGVSRDPQGRRRATEVARRAVANPPRTDQGGRCVSAAARPGEQT